jgi:hypothetical protein
MREKALLHRVARDGWAASEVCDPAGAARLERLV